MEDKKQARDILPDRGIWTVEDLSRYLGIPPDALQQKLSELGIKTLSLSRLYRHKLIRLEDLKKKEL